MRPNALRWTERVVDWHTLVRDAGLIKVKKLAMDGVNYKILTWVSIDHSLDQSGQAHLERLWGGQGCLHGAKTFHGVFGPCFDADRIQLPLSRNRVALARYEN